MGDVARFFVAECGRVVVGQSQTEFFITRFLAVLENELMAQEEETTALITLGFCENIAGETSAIGILKQNMGPFLAAEAKPFL